MTFASPRTKAICPFFQMRLPCLMVIFPLSHIRLCAMLIVATRPGDIMKTLSEIQHILQEQKPYLAEKYGVTEIGVFGSYVRGEQQPDSDLDVLIELGNSPRISLLGLVNLENYLSDLLGVKVQTAIKGNLKPRLRPYILREAVML
jgi:predicted nucleotidyltransferase